MVWHLHLVKVLCQVFFFLYQDLHHRHEASMASIASLAGAQPRGQEGAGRTRSHASRTSSSGSHWWYALHPPPRSSPSPGPAGNTPTGAAKYLKMG
jgi:hypothetical protein